MTQQHITIGPAFFAKAFNDYANWEWAIIREFFQNSIDCGSRTITVLCHEDDGKTHLTIENDGIPMSEEVLVEKLLALGGSGKNFEEGNTGGFGKAKEILYFCHDSYRIRTANLTVEGNGATYTLTQNGKHLRGTHSSIVIDGEHAEELIEQTNRWIDLAQCKTKFVINGIRRSADLKKGTPRRGLGFGKVYTNKSARYQMVVRINGMPMFTERTSFDRMVIVELTGESVEVMTSNRDGLIRPFSSELSEFVTELAVDKRSALKDRNRGPRYTEYKGTKLCHSGIDVAAVVDADETGDLPQIEELDERREYPTDPDSLLTAAKGFEELFDGLADAIDETPESGAVAGVSVIDHDEVIDDGAGEDDEVFAGSTSQGYQSHAASFGPEPDECPEPRRQVATLGTNFILKNETDLKIPRYYDPGSGALSGYSTKLIRYWGRIMLELHRLFDKEAEFSIGFIFDQGATMATEAECENGGYGLVYYLNPCRIVEQSGTYSKSFKKRFKLTERDRLIMIGCHEFVHATGQSWHDEEYANRLTDMAAFVMKNRKRFNWCFR